MGGDHRRRAEPESRGLRRTALALLVPLAILTIVGLVWLWPESEPPAPAIEGAPAQLVGDVVAIESEACPEGAVGDVNGCGTADVEVTEGAQAGSVVTAPLPNGPGAPEIEIGDAVDVLETASPDGETYAIVDHQRGTELVAVAVAFVLALVVFGRWRGVAALGGLALAFAVLLFFVVPAIMAGEPPLLVAIVGSAAIALSVLYLTHGLAMSTTVAVLGTLSALALTGLLSALTVEALHLTGITDDLSTAVGMEQQVNMEGLLLAGIVIGSLGVLDDVTVTQSVTVQELARANPSYGLGQLFRAGSRVGRSHIASVVNTIVLAYAGSSLPLLILLVANDAAFGTVVTNEVIAQEIVRSVVATVGLIAAVPVTTLLAAVAFRRLEPAASLAGESGEASESDQSSGEG